MEETWTSVAAKTIMDGLLDVRPGVGQWNKDVARRLLTLALECTADKNKARHVPAGPHCRSSFLRCSLLLKCRTNYCSKFVINPI